MSRPKQEKAKPVVIDPEMHSIIAEIASEKKDQVGRARGFTIRDVVEEALIAHYPRIRKLMGDRIAASSGAEAGDATPTPGPSQAPEAGGELPSGIPFVEDDPLTGFDLLLSVIFSADGGNSAVEALNGYVAGSLGQWVSMRDLAYHLRSALDEGKMIGSIEELVADYESGDGEVPC